MSEEKENEVKRVLNQAEISLVLDTYNDLFSSFDPRHYHERSLSEDFLSEARRAARDKREGIELHLLIPKDKRNATDEAMIKQRLRDHFRHRYSIVKEDLRKYKKQAFLLIVIGTIIGFGAVWLSLLNINDIIKHAVEIILSPASWFTIWTGFEHLTFAPKEESETEIFYRKMIDAHITFNGY